MRQVEEYSIFKYNLLTISVQIDISLGHQILRRRLPDTRHQTEGDRVPPRWGGRCHHVYHLRSSTETKRHILLLYSIVYFHFQGKQHKTNRKIDQKTPEID